ncbi:hypothetical protein [Flavobacterium phragmitis]|uniref:Restriction endonuclease n=1 Tax=Flavobacterium phragmitis TaxID=739143 RepID=A0A1I1LZS8_9FLAO|nr:hypothetical protein [Flavobacterium phragmitis]SFC78485.1 hypothetical protein SAMN05216297_102269 [Flavobacterium phragmitis]
MKQVEDKLKDVLNKYSENFSEKIYVDSYDNTDLLMNAFGITQELKSENKQYWGRELGKCWESLLRNLFETTCKDYMPPSRFGKDEPVDFFVGNDAIDAKYRVGSGDSKTLKGFESYGKMLINEGYRPVFLFLRTDNLPSALSKMDKGGWVRYSSDETFEYIKGKTNFDLKEWLLKLEKEGTYKIKRLL